MIDLSTLSLFLQVNIFGVKKGRGLTIIFNTIKVNQITMYKVHSIERRENKFSIKEVDLFEG